MPSRRTGQIINRGENKWLIRVFLGTDENGKRKYHNKTFHGNKKDAQKYLNEILREKDMGTYVEPSKDSLNKYLDHWLEASAKPRLRERTYHSYTELLKRYIRPYIGTHLLSKLTPLEIQSVYSKLQEKGLSSATIRRSHAVLTSALSQAVKWQMLSKNPAEFVDLPRQERKEMHALSTEEAQRFLKTAEEDKWYPLFLLLITTGMRPGEALGLKWKDINESKIYIQRSLVRNKKGWYLSEPKTSRSRRVVPIPPTVDRILKEHKAKQIKDRFQLKSHYENNDFVFASQAGEPLHLRNIVNRSFKPLLEKAGLPNTIRLYDLRHTCATLLLAAGENPKIVSERLGHASITLTIDTYSHVLPDMQQKATEKLESMLFKFLE